jgi:hypothetical protein
MLQQKIHFFVTSQDEACFRGENALLAGKKKLAGRDARPVFEGNRLI